MNNDYDVSRSFQRIEERLIKSMKANLTRHLNEENDLDMNWSAWQAEQLKSLEYFKKNNSKLFKNDFSTINDEIEDFIKLNYENGKVNQERIILEAIKSGKFNSNDKYINKLWHIYVTSKNSRIKKKQLSRIFKNVESGEADFFKVNDRKLKALINETISNMEAAEKSILRYTDDQYRQIIFDAQVYANTGSGTVKQAIDMATKDFLSKGINNIEYSNGRMVNIASYAEMAIRTANLRAYLQGEGTKRLEWGVHTVLVPNRGGGCPYCIKYQGKVFIDDIYSGGTEEESISTGYPLLSTAMKGKLFHPNCKDTAVTYFPGINSEAVPPTKEQLETKKENYIKDQKLNYINRNIDKYKRLEMGSIDAENVEKYHNKKLQWMKYKEKFKGNSQVSFYDVSEYDNFSKIIKNKDFETFDKFYNLKYNNIKEYSLMKQYSQAFNKNELPKELDYTTYKNNINNVNWKAVGFNSQKLNDHFNRHADELGIKNVKEYEKFAKDFINQKENENIVGFRSEDGYVFKYNIKENIFATAKPNGIIETCYKPTRGINYWKDQVKKYGKQKEM